MVAQSFRLYGSSSSGGGDVVVSSQQHHNVYKLMVYVCRRVVLHDNVKEIHHHSLIHRRLRKRGDCFTGKHGAINGCGPLSAPPPNGLLLYYDTPYTFQATTAQAGTVALEAAKLYSFSVTTKLSVHIDNNLKDYFHYMCSKTLFFDRLAIR